jgi:hypothetical protein
MREDVKHIHANINKLTTRLQLAAAVNLAFGEERPCESIEHVRGTRPERHFGPGRWYAKILHSCPVTGVKEGQVVIYCAPFVDFIQSADPNMYATCVGCKRLLKVRTEFFAVIGPVHQ